MAGLQTIRAALHDSAPAVRRFFWGSVLLGTGMAFFDVLLGLYLQGEGMTKREIGQVLSPRAIGTVVGAMAAGPLLSRLPIGRVLVAASVLGAAALAALVEVSSMLGRQCAAAAFGCAITFRIVGSSPFIFRNGSERWMSTLFGIDAAVIAGTQVLGCILAGASFGVLREFDASRGGSYRGALLVGAAMMAFSVIPYARIGEAAPKTIRARTPAEDDERLPFYLMLRLCIPFFLVGAGAGLTVPYLTLYLEDRFHADAVTIAVIYAGVAASTTLGYLASPRIARRFGLVRSIVFAELLSTPWMAALAWTQSFWVAATAFLVRGAFMNLPYPLYNQLIMRLVPPAQREHANALTKLAWNGSWVLTAWLAGILLDAFGGNYVPTMMTTVGFYLCASSSFWILFRRTGL